MMCSERSLESPGLSRGGPGVVRVRGRPERLRCGLPWAAAIGLLAATFSTSVAAAGVQIDPSLNPFGDGLRAEFILPAGATGQHPVPACLIVHGSGGLFRENAPGLPCGPEVEPSYREVHELLANLGVASLLVSSFDSRDVRFCEDNDDAYFQFVPPPFHNPGDGVPARDDAYDIRRSLIRPLDLLAGMDYLCGRPEVDCSRTCLIGTSNGGTAILGYVAQDLERHVTEFADVSTQRTHESSTGFTARATALANVPILPPGLGARLQDRHLPRFAQAIAPGCSLRQLVPTVSPDDGDFLPEQHLSDLYYPADGVELHLDIGTADSVPDACWNGGIRELQAAAYEDLAGIQASRYLLQTYSGAGHDLLDERGAEIHAKLTGLVMKHFFPSIFEHGFE